MAKGIGSKEVVMESEPPSSGKREVVFSLKALTHPSSNDIWKPRVKSFVDGTLRDEREFVLALKVQSDLSGSLGRTRASKFPHSSSSNGISKYLNNKRVKRSVAKEEQADDEEKPLMEETEDDCIISLWKKGKRKINPVKLASEENRGSGSICGPFVDEPQNVPVKFESKGEQAIKLEKSVSMAPMRRFTRSSTLPKAATIVMNGNSEVQYSLSIENPMNNEAKFPREEGTCVDTPVVIDDNSEAKNASTIKPMRRFTRSSQKTKTKPMGADGNSDVQKAFMEKPPMQITNLDLKQEVQPVVLDNNKEAHNTSSVKPLKQLSHAASKRKAKLLMMDGNGNAQDASQGEQHENHVETPIVIDSNIEVKNALTMKPFRRFTRSSLKPVANNGEVKNTSPEKPPVQFTCSILEPNAEPVVIADSRQDQNALSEKPNRQSTKLTLEVKGETLLMDGNGNLQNSLLDEPLRRFTRSTLKLSTISTMHDSGHEQLGIANDDGETTNTGSSLRSPPKKKLEMKMSKKISLSKLPSKIKELLETGMLEGLSVKYVLVGKKNVELRGTIKGGGILCFCPSCKGCKTVTPLQFQLHAGTKNRNPADCIYLDNGKSLHDILVACKSAPLDTVEATIQCAISSSTVTSSTCLNCERPLPATRTRMAMPLCSSCTESKRSQAKSVHTSGTISRFPKSSDSKPKCISSQTKKSQGKLTRKDLRLHKLVFDEDGLPDGTELAYCARGQKLLEGYKKGFGIFCHCCKTEISASQFEAHAGWASRRKPYLYIYTSNGVSLHELSLSLSKGRKFSVNDNDDLCSICADFGDLLLCDGCPRAFHKDCVGESSIPRGDWYCPYCQNMFEREKTNMHNANAKAAGRVLGVDSIEQISKRCIRIVQTLETEVGGCSLCRCPGFSKSGFGPRTIILCDQCEKEFHVDCLKDHKMANLKALPEGKWFCCASCRRIHSALQKLIVSGSERLPYSISSVIRKKQEVKGSSSNADLDIRWRLLKGKITSPESRLLLSKAVSIFHNRFDPIVDSTTGRDLIPSMVYGRNIRGQEFGGMYCAVLTVNSSVVSAGILRICGHELAEIPLVATSSDYQGQGYFQSLFSCIERLLGSLKVKNLVLPAACEAEAIWTDKFGFKKMSDDQLSLLRKDYQMTAFRGTSMLQKSITACETISKRIKEC